MSNTKKANATSRILTNMKATYRRETNRREKTKKRATSLVGGMDRKILAAHPRWKPNVFCMAQDMQMMKEKIYVMMNALRGRVSANLYELVHRRDSPFTAQMTSFSLPTKF